MTSASPAVDLRSDTVTRPTAAMRRAIAEAAVGDDVFGDDPTVKELERRIAALTGKDASLYVPSGTMGNQLAIAAQTEPGDEVLVEADSHIFKYEQGALAANSGCLAHLAHGTRGAMDPADLIAAVREEDEHNARLKLVCAENTHNRAGGTIVPLAALRELSEAARTRGVRLHLDGARLWNASVATGVPIREWAACADTTMMCFSKGLGAPVGSILTGPHDVIARARRIRKRWGGGMRQVGILAAACLHALDHHVERLADDHVRAARLAAGWRQFPGLRVPEPDTNIVLLDLDDASLHPQAVARDLERHGVRVLPFGRRRVRAVTHLDVNDAGIEQAIAAMGELLSQTRPSQLR
jgi:threonine aldolase